MKVAIGILIAIVLVLAWQLILDKMLILAQHEQIQQLTLSLADKPKHGDITSEKSSASSVTAARKLLSVDDVFRLRNDSIPKLYDLSGDDELAAFLKVVWTLDRSKYPDLSWDLLDDPRVRIAFATFWGQYLRDTTNDLQDIAATRRYAERYLHDPNYSVRADAIGYLGALGNDNDVPTLVEACSKDVLEVALNAAMGLTILMRNKAAPALKQYAGATQNPKVKEFIGSQLAAK
jgi:HEAT repeat protein